jgi:hypothetical protein
MLVMLHQLTPVKKELRMKYAQWKLMHRFICSVTSHPAREKKSKYEHDMSPGIFLQLAVNAYDSSGRMSQIPISHSKE